MTTTAPEQVLTYQGTANWAFTTTADIPVGRVIVIGYGRVTATSAPTGCTGVTLSAGAVTGFRTLASGLRASTVDLGMVAMQVTTLIPAGSTITLLSATGTGKRGGVLSTWSNVTLPPVEDATSGTDSLAVTGGNNSGPNGSGTTLTATTSGSMPAGDHLVISCMSYGGTQTITADATYTEVGKIKTTSGSSDRGCMVQYKNDSSSGTKTATATISPTGGWAATVAALPLAASLPAPDATKIGHIGDSLTSQAPGPGTADMDARYITAGYADADVNGISGRFLYNAGDTSGGTPAVIDGWAAANFNPYDVVVALGTNDCLNALSSNWMTGLTNFRNKMSTTLPGTHRFWFVNLCASPSTNPGGADGEIGTKGNTVADYNAFLAANLNGTTEKILDWNAYAKTNLTDSSYWNADGVHMTNSGYTARNAWIQSRFTVTPPLVFKERTSGGTWQTLTAKRWNGTAWETLTVKEY